jgi:hypothetical protein
MKDASQEGASAFFENISVSYSVIENRFGLSWERVHGPAIRNFRAIHFLINGDATFLQLQFMTTISYVCISYQFLFKFISSIICFTSAI